MKTPYLIQRLLLPRPRTACFSLAVGNFGFIEDDFNKFAQIFSFDSMGSAEFGSWLMPQAFNDMAYTFSQYNGVSGRLDLQKPIFYLTSKTDEDEAKDFITQLALQGDDAFYFKEKTYFQETLNRQKHFSRYQGWIVLDTPLIFFVNELMFHKIKKIF